MRGLASIALTAFLLPGATVAPAAENPPQLAFPLACTFGEDCFVQQYADVRPGPEAGDYNCGDATYDGHKGTDIRLRSTADTRRGVAVLAAADGIVMAVRDGVGDRLMRTGEDRKAVASRECGNGVLLYHGDGWQTQYCHLLNGSVAVAKGDTVKVGDRLGSVGFSGAAAFPHLHIEVRHQGQVVDPFRGEAGDGETCGPGPVPLWTPAVLNELAYRPTQLLDAGFAAGPVQLTEPEEGTVVVFDNAAEPAAMVGWGWAINLEPGDELTVVLDGPRGEMARNSKTMPRRKAQYLLFAGRRTPPQGWPAGAYRLSVSVTRDGAAVVETVRELSVH